LTPYEYVTFTKLFGLGVAELDRFGDPCLKRSEGACVFQSPEGLCGLQALGLKPLACKVWPFKVVRAKSLDEASPDDAFVYRGEVYRAYVNSSCLGIGHGTREGLVEAIKEVIEIKRDPQTPQRYTTAQLKPSRLAGLGTATPLARPLAWASFHSIAALSWPRRELWRGL